MQRFAVVLTLGVVLCVAGPALAQRGRERPNTPGAAEKSDEIKKLEAQLSKLQAAVKDVESKLSKLKGDKKPEEKKADDKKPGFPDRGGFGPFGGSGRGRFGPPGGFPGFPGGRGRPGAKKEDAKPGTKSSDLEKKLDQIIRDVEELKKEIRRR
jgi:uncharacterized protein YlxW (UPF0749 family)